MPAGQACTDLVCVHFVGGAGDAPPPASSTGTTPDWVALTLRTAQESDLRMVELGWPLPPGDPGAGGSAQFDVYLEDLGRRGLYGYCAPEDLVSGERNVASSYCVLDNDFAEFALPPTPSMRVTVAHELFHAVQFGIDAREDGWFLEATATWMEEQVTDDVDDNRQYLRHGQLGDPGTRSTPSTAGSAPTATGSSSSGSPSASAARPCARSGPARTGTSGVATTSRSGPCAATSSPGASRGRASTPASSPPTAPPGRRTPRGRPTGRPHRRAAPGSARAAHAGRGP